MFQYLPGLLCLIAATHPAHAEDFKSELRAIAMVESYNGRYIEHPLVTKGIHKDTRAGGLFGLMPITVKELVARSAYLKNRYSQVLGLTNQELTAELNSNRDLDLDVATYFWRKLRARSTLDQAACHWYRGPGADCEDVSSDEYVQKFRSYFDGTNP